MKHFVFCSLLALAVMVTGKTVWQESWQAYAQETGSKQDIANVRGNLPINTEPKAPPIPKVENTDIKQKRDYPMQPPLVPHKTDNYQVDKNANKCLSCHSRRLTEESQAPMISVTHYMDRDGNFLADVSPRRYFCNQCHVTQTNAKPLVTNQFIDVDKLLRKQ